MTEDLLDLKDAGWLEVMTRLQEAECPGADVEDGVCIKGFSEGDISRAPFRAEARVLEIGVGRESAFRAGSLKSESGAEGSTAIRAAECR